MVKVAERAEWLVGSGEESERKIDREKRDWKERGVTKKKKERKKERRNRERSSQAVINEDKGGPTVCHITYGVPWSPTSFYFFFFSSNTSKISPKQF